MPRVKLCGIAVVALFVASICLADATVEQKTHVKFSGVVGGIMNVFGGKAAREGITSTVVVKGNRRLTNSGSTGEIVDLAEEKIYQLDYDRKSYKVVTFAEIRKQLEEAQKSAKSSGDSRGSSKQKQEGPELEVDFDVKETGKKQTINGFDTKEVVLTVAVREKGKKLEESGGWVLTSDMWMGPNNAAMRELADFDVRYVKKLYGGTGIGSAMQQMAMLMATTPAFAKAMKTFSEKQSSLAGTPIRATMYFETVVPPGQAASASEDRSSSPPTSLGAAAIGGLMGKLKQRQQAKESSQASAAPPAANRSRLFESTTEVLKAWTSASATDVALPAGFTQR